MASTDSEARELLPRMHPRDTLLISAGSGRGCAAGIPGIAVASGLRDLEPLNKSSYTAGMPELHVTDPNATGPYSWATRYFS